ncbi:CoA transferase, partial [Escherichia coli]|nr:CoA transferase [Escherichia coli]
MQLPLCGITVVDFSRVLAGPFATMTLGDMGADVIKVELPERGDDTRDWGILVAPRDSSYFCSFNRNKRSIVLDLSRQDDCAVALQLCATADVIVENFRAGGMEKFGLGYEALRERNPRHIYCAISGYDRAGPEASRPGYDLVIQGESGIMAINGEPGQKPLKFGVAAVDMFTGMYAAQAILAALVERHRTGVGRRIDLALYDCGVMISSYYGLESLLEGRDPRRFGNGHPSIVPYGVFDAKDGPLVIAVGTNRQFRDLCKALGNPALADDDRFVTNSLRSLNRTALLESMQPLLQGSSRANLLAVLSAAGIPCGEVLGLHQALTSERSRMAGLIGSHAHPRAGDLPIYNSPWRFDGDRLPVRRPPMLGEH